MKKEKKSTNLPEENKEKSFFDKMKTDKKYNAKVQLIGYGVLIVALVLYLNISNTGNSSPISNSLIGSTSNNEATESTDKDKTSLLKQLGDNYRYDITIEVQKQNEELIEDTTLHYFGKSYDNQLEITKEDKESSTLYYKVDERYYTKEETEMNFISEDTIYELVAGEYIELASILKLMDKASLDHVTDYSSGKKEYVYHLKVKDVIVSYQKEDVVEINVKEENNILTIELDYSVLLSVIDEDIKNCQLKATISEIGDIEAFSVLNEEENEDTSNEENASE